MKNKRVHIPVTVETPAGPVHGHITGDPDMPESTRNALTEMMRILANEAMKEHDKRATEALRA